MKKLSEEYPERHTRPVSRYECELIPRPCPFVGCRHHLYLDVNEKTGSIKFNYPDIEPLDMKESCCLDIAATGEKILEVVGSLMNMTGERVRQIEDGIFEELALVDEVGELNFDFQEAQNDRNSG